MMNTIQQWLGAATQRLPQTLAETIQDELLSHYQDSYDDYLLRGFAIEQAIPPRLAA